MNCTKCNATLTNDETSCSQCGAKIGESFLQGQSINANIIYSNTNGIPNHVAPKFKGNFQYYAIIIAFVLLIIVGIIIVILTKDNNKHENGTRNNDNQVVQISTYRVNSNGFTFQIPNNMITKTENGSLMIGGEDNTWAALIEVLEQNFDYIKDSRMILQANFRKNGYEVGTPQLKSISGREFVTYELSDSNDNMLVAITKATPSLLFVINAVNTNNNFDYLIIEKLMPIISTATYSAASTNIQLDFNINYSEIFKFDN